LRSPLPIEFNSSVRSSAYIDRNNPSVNTDGLTDGRLRIKKKRAVRWRGGYCGYFLPTESPRDSKKSALYGDETGSPMNMPTESPRNSKWQLRTVTRPVHRWKMPTESPRDSKRQLSMVTCPIYCQNSRRNHGRNRPSVNPSAKVNISPLTRPYPPLFLLLLLLLLPYLNSPQLQTTSPPPKKNLPLLSTTSHISWSLLVTVSVFWFTYGFLSVFVSNSIFLNFNI